MNTDELKDFIKDLLENRSIKTDMEFKLIRQELAAIIEKTNSIKFDTSKTNGRVTVLEAKVFELEKISDNHYFNCPNNKSIRDLQDNNLGRNTIKKWLWAAITIISSCLALYFSIEKLFQQ